MLNMRETNLWSSYAYRGKLNEIFLVIELICRNMKVKKLINGFKNLLNSPVLQKKNAVIVFKSRGQVIFNG